jgi:hypothetical protein
MLNEINYILLDAARMGDVIEKAKEINTEYDSLYRGRSEESLASVAPYIFLFRQNTDFGTWYMDEGWGDAWGILIKSILPMPDLHRHFRKFLIVGTEDNQELYFRFYDPRVLRIFLPTCDQQQLREFFGPIEYFIMEDEDPAFAIRCWLENGHLRSIKVPRDEFVNNTFRFPGPKTATAVPIPQSDVNYEPEQDHVPVKPKKQTSFNPFADPLPSEKKPLDPTPRQQNPPQTPPAKKPEEKKNDKDPDSKWNNFFFD